MQHTNNTNKVANKIRGKKRKLVQVLGTVKSLQSKHTISKQAVPYVLPHRISFLPLAGMSGLIAEKLKTNHFFGFISVHWWNRVHGAGGMVQWLRTLTLLQRTQVWSPASAGHYSTFSNSTFRGSIPFFGIQGQQACTRVHIQRGKSLTDKQ